MSQDKPGGDRAFFFGLDLLRASAALLVFAGHLRNLFFVDYSEAANAGLPVRFFYLITGLGHQAVMIFFVLSGLLVGGKVIADIRGGTWSWRRYLLERGSRLCIVLWPALLLTFVLDSAGQAFFGPALYGEEKFGSNTLPPNVALVSTPDVYLANAFFLQGVLRPTAGTNTPLWSLSNEFWYYVIFPALLLAFQSLASARSRIPAVLVAALTGGILFTGGMLGGFFIWMMGVACALSPRRARWLSLGAGSLSLVAVLALSRFHLAGDYGDLLIGFTTAILCFGLLQFPGRAAGILFRPVHFFSNFSYTLYLTHLPLVVFLRAWVGGPRWQPEPGSLLPAAGLGAAVLASSYLIYRLTEAHTGRLRRYLLSRFVPAAPPAAEKPPKAA